MTLTLKQWKEFQMYFAKLLLNGDNQGVEKSRKILIDKGYDKIHIHNLIHVTKVKFSLGIFDYLLTRD